MHPTRFECLALAPHPKLFLGDNRAGIDSGVDVMDGYPLWGIVKPAPEIGVCPSIPWKQRDVDIDDAVFVLLEDIALHDLAMTKRYNEINSFAWLRD